MDPVIWNEDHAGYRQLLQDQILGLIAAGIRSAGDRPGGIFVRRAEQISEEDRVLFESVARAVISDKRGTLAEQISPAKVAERRLRGRGARWSAPRLRVVHPATPPEPRRRDLDFFNGSGRFSADGREYVITTSRGQPTPAPWVNVWRTRTSEPWSRKAWPTRGARTPEFRLTP